MYTPNYYQPYMQQMPSAQPVQMQAQPQPQQNNGIIWAQGESGAKSYYVEPGRSALIMDSEENKFFIKTVDQSGMPLPLRIFEYNEITEVQQKPQQVIQNPGVDYITREEFKRLEERIDALTAKKQGKKPEKGDEDNG